MLLVFLVVVFALVLIILLYGLMFLACIKEGAVTKTSAFESGFLSMVKIQSSFSIHFFIVMLMFVIFDLEIVMFLGLLVSDSSSLLVFLLLLLFVISGFYMEWFYGKLIWIV